MEALSWFKFSPVRWSLGKTSRLSHEEKSDYLDLCSAYWSGGCVMSADEMRQHSDRIDLFIRRGLVGDDGIEWLNAQFEDATRKTDQARKAAEKRWSKSERNADAMQPHSDSNASVMQRRENREEREEEKERERDKRASADNLAYDSEGNEIEPQATQEKSKLRRARFVPPTEQEVELFFQTTASPASWEAFYNYYLANGWRVGRNPMKDWKAAARGWVSREKQYNKPSNNGKRQPVTEELMRDIANDIANGGWNFAEGA